MQKRKHRSRFGAEYESGSVSKWFQVRIRTLPTLWCTRYWYGTVPYRTVPLAWGWILRGSGPDCSHAAAAHLTPETVIICHYRGSASLPSGSGFPVFGIRDILERMQILGSVPQTNGSGHFFSNFKDAKGYFFHTFSYNLKVGTNENGSACGRWLSIGIYFTLWWLMFILILIWPPSWNNFISTSAYSSRLNRHRLTK
jgi:hypothetical protein